MNVTVITMKRGLFCLCQGTYENALLWFWFPLTKILLISLWFLHSKRVSVIVFQYSIFSANTFKLWSEVKKKINLIDQINKGVC